MSKREKPKTEVAAKTEKPGILSAKTEKPISKVTKTAKPKNPMPPSLLFWRPYCVMPIVELLSCFEFYYPFFEFCSNSIIRFARLG